MPVLAARKPYSIGSTESMTGERISSSFNGTLPLSVTASTLKPAVPVSVAVCQRKSTFGDKVYLVASSCGVSRARRLLYTESMVAPILATKLYLPPRRSAAVSRPRLIDRLNQGLRGKLTLISAPAGSGKSTLISEWAATSSNSGAQSPASTRIAWLALDEGDADPVRFLAYLVAAVQTVDVTLGIDALALLQSPRPPPVESLLTMLLNDLALLTERLILVLDDYHVIEAPPVDQALSYLLDHLPSQVHLVIITREDPNLHLARLRGRGQLNEVRAADLRFTAPEAARFLNQAMGLALSADEIEALLERTEGWAVGLQLAALALQGAIVAEGPDVSARFIASFTGSHHFVMDYLVEEVLQQQPAQLQAFLLETAILQRLTGPLCDALTGQDTGQETLERLERTNLFIISLDDERRWYRYHHLFAELLRQRSNQARRDELPALHQRASVWYEQHAIFDEAIEHALLARDFARAAAQIERVAESLWAGGIDSRLRRWLEALPADLRDASPHLCIFHAWYLLAAGQQEAAEEAIRVAEAGLRAAGPDAIDPGGAMAEVPAVRDRLSSRGKVAVLHAFAAFYRGDGSGIIHHARQALADLPDNSLAWRGPATHLLGDGYDFNGEMEKAHAARTVAIETNGGADQLQNIIANLKLAITLRHMGRLPEVVTRCQQQNDIAHASGMAHSVVGGWLLAIWGEALAERNQLAEALEKARQGVELTERGGDVAMLGWSYLCLIRVLFSHGEIAEADAIVRKIEFLAHEAFVPPWIVTLNRAWQVRLWLAQGEVETAAAWAAAHRLDPCATPVYHHEIENMTLARVMLAQGKAAQAMALIQRQCEAAQASGRKARVIEMLVILALAREAEDDRRGAIAALRQALTRAEPGGFMQIFVDEGPPLATLLRAAGTRGVQPAYVRRLLAASTNGTPAQSVSPPRRSQTELVEPLSQRELEVLELVAQGLSNREISERLYLSLNTIKGHNRNIFGKLAVRRRTEAIARARELGLL